MSKTTEQKIAEAERKLEVIARRRARLDSFERRVKRQLRSLRAALTRKGGQAPAEPEPPPPAELPAEPEPPPAPAEPRLTQEERRERRLAELLVEMQHLAEGFAKRLGVLRPTVRYIGTRGACKHAARAHVHCHGKRRGIICVARSYVETISREDPQGEPRRLMAHEVCHLAGKGGRVLGHCIRFYELMTELLGDGGAGARNEWGYKQLAARLGRDPLTPLPVVEEERAAAG